MSVTFAAVLLSAGQAFAEPERGEFAYASQDFEDVMVFFDMGRKVSLFGRRDAKSIGMGDPDQILPCDLGRYCVKLLSQDVPLIVLGEGETLDVPGLRARVDQVTFGDSAPCNRTRVWADNGDYSENVHCSVIGMVTIKFQSKDWEDQDLFLKSWHGFGATDTR